MIVKLKLRDIKQCQFVSLFVFTLILKMHPKQNRIAECLDDAFTKVNNDITMEKVVTKT